MAESFLHEAVTGVVTVAATAIGWMYKDHHKRLEKVEDCTRKIKTDIPDKYISIPDCDRIHQATSRAAEQMLERMDAGFQRIHGRIDQLQTESAQRHDKLRDLIDERTRK